MICKEIEKMIPSCLEDDLDTDDLREFMEHVERCNDCMEELSIQFLVTEGMARLESGSVFDLQNELLERLENAEHTLKLRENMKWLLFVLQGFVAVELIALLLLFIVLY